MASQFSLLGLLWILKIGSVFSISEYLDTEADKTALWKITGHVVYVEDGKTLLEKYTSEYLPSDFKPSKSFGKTNGIWMVVPKECGQDKVDKDGMLTDAGWNDDKGDGDGSCNNVTSTATFRFNTMAQLLDSVSVRYIFGGNATINITGGKVSARTTPGAVRSDKWTDFPADLDSRTMQLEATVYSKDAYILVDKITINYQTTPSSPKTTTTTTTSTPEPVTPPEPASGQETRRGAVFVIALAYFVTVSLI